ncbi:carbohydrate kinase [Sulfuricella denitrificans skB26]|uniref:Bifunctional NAD(P)H-hydrate repair enzyme n=1 Tax=Sulfuricella denitrificans (strain DSM 22764 / NBRC 105220 / skB26) TaxID=1163617 RepID=S6AGW9_SULDS|nr:bifunctional ADP-dependent NAD(P)H-hydrate dehydratase/NAD(P)H-hydrate epimerase [Sulfuricella denitrificans]BAN35286.1 carbohydrate kinase [Sulfuricella denitrificans skB26]
MKTPIYFSHEIRQLEQLARESGISDLMERAGMAAAELARELLAGKTSVLVIAGPGNNGGDALVAARHLKAWWFKVNIVFIGETAKLPPDAANALQAWLAIGGELLDAIPADGKWDMVIDGLFGIGLARELSGRYLELVREINRMNLPVLALDIPSGLDADAGQTFRAAIHASHTLSFIALKPGLLTAYGPDYCGQIHVDTLELDAPALLKPNGWLLEKTEVAAALKPRPRNSHKGMLGSVGILGGASAMCGAALLAGRAALKLGAGRVYAALLADAAPAVDIGQPELMLCAPEKLFQLDHLNCLAVGPGLGQSPQAVQLLRQALETELPLVLDADALNLLAIHDDMQELTKSRKGSTILTPHSAEAARLLSSTTHDIQQERVHSATLIAQRLNCLVVLKGAGSICATPKGEWFVNPTGNPGMSSAGMGDVLSGMIAALIAQRLTPQSALLLAVYLHGAAADDWVEQGVGPIGLTATEVADAARMLLNRWIYSPVA